MLGDAENRLTPGAGLELFGQLLREERKEADLCGRRLGGYELTEFIASGGMSAVYRARRADGSFDRDVAVKVSTQSGIDDRYRRRFMLEQQMLATLNHPNIAQLYDVGVSEEGWPYIVMEFVEGQPIDEFVRTRSAATDDTVRLLIRVAEALVFAHNRLIIHRDIKPSNVLVTDAGVPKLLDFGIAKQLGDSDLTMTQGLSPLTPRFASPEQLANQPVSVSSDVYQLGVLAVTLINQAPWGPDTLQAAAAHAVQGTREPLPQELVRALPRDLTAILERATETDAERRYGTVADFLAELQRWQSGHPVKARRPSVLYRTHRFVARNRWTVATAAVAIATLTLGSFSYTLSLGESRRAAERAAQQAQAINEFLLDMMKQASPERGGKLDLSARELLAQAVTQIDGLDPHPAIRAGVRQALGEVYLELGENDRAETLLEQALADRMAVETPVSERAETLTSLGTVDFNRGDFQQALDHYERARALLMVGYAPNDPALIQTQHLIGNAYIRLGRLDDAERIMREVLALREQSMGPFHPDIGRTLSTLGLLASWRGDLDQAEAHYLSAIEHYEQTDSTQTAPFAGLLDNYGFLLANKGDGEQALAYHQQALEIVRAFFGGDHERVAGSLARLANAQMDLGNEDDAIALGLQSVEMYHRLASPPNYMIFGPLMTVAHLFHGKGDADQAIAASEEGWAVAKRQFGDSHWRVGYVMINHAVYSFSRIGFDRSQSLLLEGLSLIQASDRKNTIVEVESIQRLGEIYEAAGRYAGASREYDRALALAERVAADAAFTHELREKALKASQRLEDLALDVRAQNTLPQRR